MLQCSNDLRVARLFAVFTTMPLHPIIVLGNFIECCQAPDQVDGDFPSGQNAGGMRKARANQDGVNARAVVKRKRKSVERGQIDHRKLTKKRPLSRGEAVRAKLSAPMRWQRHQKVEVSSAADGRKDDRVPCWNPPLPRLQKPPSFRRCAAGAGFVTRWRQAYCWAWR